MITRFNLIDFFVSSNFYVSLGVSCLTALSMHVYRIENYHLQGFVFFSTLFLYNFIRLVPGDSIFKSVKSNRHKFIYDHNIYLWALVIFSGLFSIYFVLPIFRFILWPLIISAVISLAYGLPILRFKSSWNRMREVPGLKIFLIAFVWAIVTEGFPNLLANQDWSLLALLERFLFVVAITIPFDIRDLKFDRNEILTIPQYFGVKWAKFFGIICLVAAEIILAYRTFIAGEINLIGCLAIYITYEVSTVLVYFSKEQMSERYVTLGVEGMSILMGILFMLSQVIP